MPSIPPASTDPRAPPNWPYHHTRRSVPYAQVSTTIRAPYAKVSTTIRKDSYHHTCMSIGSLRAKNESRRGRERERKTEKQHVGTHANF
eukprot:992949-Rhodomonas_salina.1